MDYFKKLSGFRLKEILEDKGYKTFLRDWEILARIRNSLVHTGSLGNIAGMNDREINDLILRLTGDSIEVFTLINNKVVKSNRISAD